MFGRNSAGVAKLGVAKQPFWVGAKGHRHQSLDMKEICVRYKMSTSSAPLKYIVVVLTV